MVDSKQTGPLIPLYINTGDAATEVFIMNSNLERIRQTVGNRAKFDLPSGLYLVKVKSGNVYEEKLVDLNRSQTLTFKKAVIDSPAPLEGTRQTHESHVGNAANHSKKINKTIGEQASSQLYLFVRDWTSKTPSPINKRIDPAAGLTIRSVGGQTLVDIAQDGDHEPSDWDPWTACNVALPPDNYLLTLQKPDGTLIQQTVSTCQGWQTQVFLLMSTSDRKAKYKHADLANATVYMRQIGIGFDPLENGQQNKLARLTELARQGLVSKRRVLSREVLHNILQGKFEDPMLGILGGHLLLLNDSIDTNLLKIVVVNLRQMLGSVHPDVEALAVYADIASDCQFLCPPMLLSSWSILLKNSIDNPAIIPASSLANEVADTMWGGSPWLLWRLDKATDAERKQVYKQQIQRQIRRITTEDDNTEEGLESFVQLDTVGQPQTSMEALTHEQCHQLVQTMGLPLARIKQML